LKHLLHLTLPGRLLLKEYHVVVIGASAAGVAAAITARRHYPDKSIFLIRKEELVPIPCGIPYAFGIVGTPDKNLIPADSILAKNNIEGVVDEVVDIDRGNQRIVTASGDKIGYRKLVLATGSEPMVPPIPGTDKANVFTIKKDVPYLQQVISQMEGAKNLCIIGGGFIGVEIAEECRRSHPDLHISIIEMLSHCLQLVYDEDFSLRAEEILQKQNISLVLNDGVDSLLGNGTVEKLQLQSGKILDADMVILGIGAVANTTLAQKAGLKIGTTRGIAVNRYMQTSDSNIFACGDCTEKVSFFDGTPSGLKLASIATMEARVAGANLFHTRRANRGVIGVYSTALGDCAFAAAGLTRAQALEKGYAIIEGQAESVNRHPGCMPGGDNMKVKLLFEAGTQILIGGQVMGAKSGGEVINTISACIHQRMTADDIATFQTGTHPALTASPIAYQLVNAAEMAIKSAS
jgi:NADPH-dependent 2,4-dienoyl-CoA reductase/sulfur reductase-like enzyme